MSPQAEPMPERDLAAAASAAAPARERGEGAPALAPAALLAEVVSLALDRKAIDVVELDMRAVAGYTDWFVICSGGSDRQVRAIHDAILQGLKRRHGLLPRRVDGLAQGQWVLMDYLDVVVHIFTPRTRDFYRLEQLWGEAPARTVSPAQETQQQDDG